MHIIVFHAEALKAMLSERAISAGSSRINIVAVGIDEAGVIS